MSTELYQLPESDKKRLRELARRKLEMANDPVNLERRQAWYNLDSGENDRVMVLAEFEGVDDPKKPLDGMVSNCEHPVARGLAWSMLSEQYRFETLKDDHVIEPCIYTTWDFQMSEYGVERVTHSAETGGGRGAKSWDAPIKDIQKDFDKLKPRTYSVDKEKSLAKADFLRSIFDGIMEVEFSHKFWWTFGMTGQAINLIGLENLMLFMYDDPDGLHQLMGFLRDQQLALAKWLEEEGLLTLDNKNQYTGSGSLGYTHKLPQKDWKKGDKVRTKDLWVLLESQETVLVGPDHFQEFIYPYQEDIAKEFGKVYYGCCEPVNNRWHILKNMSNMDRVSVSPWCDEAFMAEALGREFGYSRKPNPTLISTSTWDEDLIRKDLRTTLDIAKNCRLEIIMKDVHTLDNQPERLARWVELAREEIAKTN